MRQCIRSLGSSFNTGGVIWLSANTRTAWPSRLMLRSMQCTLRVLAPRTQGYTAAHHVETRLPSQVVTHFRLKTIGSTILPMVRSGGSFWFIQYSRASDNPGSRAPFRPRADIRKLPSRGPALRRLLILLRPLRSGRINEIRLRQGRCG